MTTSYLSHELLDDGSASTWTNELCVRVRGLCKRIDDRPILHDINLDIAPGSFIALLGPNGAGKSTLLNVLSTLTGFTSGELYLFGQRVQRSNVQLRARIGLLGHQPMLYRDLTAMENLVFFGRLYGVANPQQRATELLERVALQERGNDPAGVFSRGMLQRLAVARSLVHDPQIILADEPFSGLDLPSIQAVETLFSDLHRQGKTILLSNHDVAQSLRLVQRVLVLRKGRLIADGPASPARERDVIAKVTGS